jgi:hypothetical protein
MKTQPKQWLTTRAALPGMLACGFRTPDGSIIGHSLEELCPDAALEKILKQYESMHAALFSEGVAPRWSTWGFEQGLIRYVLRSDGWLLGMVARPQSDAHPKLDPLSAEFLSLEFE